MTPVIVECDFISPYGHGIETCWQGLLASESTFKPIARFNTSAFTAAIGACVDGLDSSQPESLCYQLLSRLLSGIRIPPDAHLLLGTTAAEIDLLERHVLLGTPPPEESSADSLLTKIKTLIGTDSPCAVISAACTSSTVALGQAAALVTSGTADAVMVTAADIVSEFVFSGFSTLMALDRDGARPFDADRKGLSLGEAAGYALVMSEKRAAREGRSVIARINGWGVSNDANHMTGPARDGKGLADAISAALSRAKLAPEDIGSVGAHGTGTVYNDAMEIKAFETIFKNAVPVYSIKGGLGHTLGTAGLLETIIAIRSLYAGKTPGTPRLQTVASEALNWVTPSAVDTPNARLALTTNSGFGGVNAALIVGLPDQPESASMIWSTNKENRGS